MTTKHEIATRTTTAISTRDFDAQLALCNSLPPSARPAIPYDFIIHNELVRTESGGLIIRKRNKPLDVPDSSHEPPSILLDNSASSRTGYGKAFRRGKYNDEGRLMGKDHGTMEMGEVGEAWRARL